MFLTVILASLVFFVACEKDEDLLLVNEPDISKSDIEVDNSRLKSGRTIAQLDALPDYVGKIRIKAFDIHGQYLSTILRFVDPVDMPLETEIGKKKFTVQALPIKPTFGDPAWVRKVYYDDNNSGIASGNGHPYEEMYALENANTTAKQIRDALMKVTPYVKFKGHASKNVEAGDNDVNFRMTTLKGRIYATFEMGKSFENSGYVARAVFRRYPEPKNRYFSSEDDKINDVAWFYWSNIDATAGAKVDVMIKIFKRNYYTNELELVEYFNLADRGVNWEGVPQSKKGEKRKFRVSKGTDKYVRVKIHMSEEGHPVTGHKFWARTVATGKNLNFGLNCTFEGK